MKEKRSIADNSENLSKAIDFQRVSDNNSLLQQNSIAISVSESEELEILGLSSEHIKDISIELARYLIVNGATLLYGGDLRVGGFTEVFSELSFQYKRQKDRSYRFINYFAFPISKKLSTNYRAEFLKKQVEAKVLEVPKHLGVIDQMKEYQPFISIQDRYVIAECLTDMRIQMATDCNARIVLGGRQKGFTGYFPGIVEEAYHSLKANKPIYLLGGYGGAAKSIVDVICGNKPKELTNEFQFNTKFLMEFRDWSTGRSAVKVDYDYLIAYLQKHTVESISQNNGLSVGENQILFNSTNIHELVFIIIKGLQSISRSK